MAKALSGGEAASTVCHLRWAKRVRFLLKVAGWRNTWAARMPRREDMAAVVM